MAAFITAQQSGIRWDADGEEEAPFAARRSNAIFDR
jgi:hypothetical protein